jgi:putative endonuclease
LHLLPCRGEKTVEGAVDTGGNRRKLGAAGEAAALRHLETRGFRIVETNVRCRLGEIDLVVLDGAVIVFVEVKGNRGGRYGAPEEMVT